MTTTLLNLRENHNAYYAIRALLHIDFGNLNYTTISSARVSRDSRNQTHEHGGESQPFQCGCIVDVMKRRGATAAVTRIYFLTETTKGGKPMKTKLDTMNHRQRATFARSLYHRPTMARNAVTAASAYGIKGVK